MTADFKTLRYELHCQWVGPMPIESFLQDFLAIDQSKLEQKPKLPEDYFDSVLHPVTPSEVHLAFIKLVRDSGIMPNLHIFPCLDDETDLERRPNPDMVAYDSDSNSNPNQAISYERCELIFKLDRPLIVDIDIFEDLSEEGTAADLEGFLSRWKNKVRVDCRAQLTYHARAWMSRQHRTHCFMVWIGDPWARIIRFDRSGAIVTERFSIRSGRLLVEFLWRFSCATPEMRGKDATVSIVTDEAAINFAQEKLNKWAPDFKGSQHVLKLNIPDGGSSDNPEWREVLVWGPLADPQCVVGRATRGYPAWDLKDNKLVFVKDSWRALGDNLSKETDILKALNDAQVCNVPTLVCGDDLPGQMTMTQEFVNAEWNMGGKTKIFSKRVHIRFVTDLIGTRLTEFKTSEQFVRAWLDALLAHEEAYTKCKILHRDISLDNILLKPGGGGFLNDWDLARRLDDIDAPGPPQPSRLGTWPFMSVNLLGRLDKKNTLQDDLESFFWVLLYVTLRYLSTSISESGESVPLILKLIFDVALNNGKVTLGGSVKKEVVMESKHLGDEFSVTGNIPLTLLVEDILIIMRPYFEYWQRLNMEVKSLARNKEITLAAARELYLAPETLDRFEFSKHESMIALTRKALAKKWPTKEPAEDRCARPFKCSGEDSGAGTKRSRSN